MNKLFRLDRDGKEVRAVIDFDRMSDRDCADIIVAVVNYVAATGEPSNVTVMLGEIQE